MRPEDWNTFQEAAKQWQYEREKEKAKSEKEAAQFWKQTTTRTEVAVSFDDDGIVTTIVNGKVTRRTWHPVEQRWIEVQP